MSEFDQPGAEALARLLSEVLSDPRLRQAFRADPQKTAIDAGIEIGAMPPRVVAMLADLSGSELRLLSEINFELIKGGLKVDVGTGDGGEESVSAARALFTHVRSLGVL